MHEFPIRFSRIMSSFVVHIQSQTELRATRVAICHALLIYTSLWPRRGRAKHTQLRRKKCPDKNGGRFVLAIECNCNHQYPHLATVMSQRLCETIRVAENTPEAALPKPILGLCRHLSCLYDRRMQFSCTSSQCTSLWSGAACPEDQHAYRPQYTKVHIQPSLMSNIFTWKRPTMHAQ